MASDLTPAITRMYDSAEFQAGGTVRDTTVIQFTIGPHGPFIHTFARNPPRAEIEAVMQARRAALEGLA